MEARDELVPAPYPFRPPLPMPFRALIAFFGVAILGSAASGSAGGDAVFAIAGVLIGVVWLAFGLYGGYPLVDTVPRWSPPDDRESIRESDCAGLAVIRKRKRIVWATVPIAFVLVALFMPLVLRGGKPQWLLLGVAPPMLFVYFRYQLSRCPRCGFGFFARSTNRAAPLRSGSTCATCGLTLADAEPRR